MNRGRARHALPADRPLRIAPTVPETAWTSRCFAAPPLENPLPGEARIALVTEHFRTRAQIRCISPDRVDLLREFASEILAGSAAELLALRASGLKPRAILALSGGAYGALTRTDRDALWSSFGVPVFENHLGPDGQLIARECEAHAGLHLVAGTPPAGLIVSEGECDCGRATPRIFFPAAGLAASRAVAAGVALP